jgi:ABC-2 type transport system permease protein
VKNAIHDVMVITKRQLLQLARVPELLVFSTIQPVMFVLLFRFVFGGSIDSGQPGGYVQLLMPGIFVQTVAFTLASTAVGLAEDMKKGLIDRFRSLPISRGAVIIGRTFGDALLNILVLVVMALAGYAVGWRPTSGIVQTTLAFLFLFMFGYALSWIGILVGLSVKEARTVQSVGFLVTFPLTFLCRQLFGLKNEFGATANSWPSQNPLETSLLYMVILMAIFIPLSIRKYKNYSN